MHGLHQPWLAEQNLALVSEASLGGVHIFCWSAQTHWMFIPSVQRGVYPSLDRWDWVLAMNYGTCKDRRDPGAGGSGVLIAVAPDGTKLWTLPDRYLFFPAQQSNVGFRWGTEGTLLRKVWYQGRRRALDGMIFLEECHLLQVDYTNHLISCRHMPPRYWRPSWLIDMSLKP